MKKNILKIIFCVIILAGILLIGKTVLADEFGLQEAGDTSGLTSTELSKKADIPTILGYVAAIALSLVGVYFFIMLLLAGFTWMTAAGSSEKVTKAKDKIITAIIGLVIVLSAYAIINFVLQYFLNSSGSSQ